MPQSSSKVEENGNHCETKTPEEATVTVEPVPPEETAVTVEPVTPEEARAMVESLGKVVACHRHLASCVGGSTDGPHLREEIRKTRERAHTLAVSCRHHLTVRLRDKGLAEAERKEAELDWVAFSSALELFHADMCKVFNTCNHFSLAKASALVQTGIQGDTKEVTARALSVPDLQHEERSGAPTDSGEQHEQGELEKEITLVDRTIEDMEQKVNVLRWTVEAQGPQDGELVSTDSASLALLNGDDVPVQGGSEGQNKMLAVAGLCSVAAVGLGLGFCVVFLW